jgi:alkylation response protein AidB-like acyl-CoA dehydrogenase
MIDLLPSGEQQQIIDSVGDFFARADLTAAASADERKAGHSLGLRREMGALGWFGLGLGEAHGGVGYSLIEEMLVAREFGRHLASPGLSAAMIAAHVAVHCSQRSLARDILSGEAGVGMIVPGGAGAAGDVILVAAQEAQLVLYWNETGAGLYQRNIFAGAPMASFDESVDMSRVARTAERPLAWVPAAQLSLPTRLGLLICAQLVGVAEAAKDLAVSHAKAREQFGQPIGGFQAIKHACAEMAVQCEAVYAQTFFAGLAVDAGLPDAAFQYAAAGLLTPVAALANTRAGIQIHGGLGFTSDCAAHRFLKRAHLLNWLAIPARRFRATCLAIDPHYA